MVRQHEGWQEEKVSFKIQVEGTDTWYECDEYEPILECLERNDVLMDCDCRVGVCGACKAVLVEGKVNQEEQGVLTHEELDLDLVLTCVSYPESDCVVRINS